MADIATLGLRVDASGAIKGVQEFNRETEKLAKSGAAAERATASLNQEATRAAEKARIAARAERDWQQAQAARARETAIATRQTAEQSAREAVKGFELSFEDQAAKIRYDLVRGLISPRQARQAGIAAAREFNLGVVQTIQRAQTAGAIRGEAIGAGLFRDLAGQLKTVEEGARKSGLGLARLNNSMVVVARNALGLSSTAGRLIDTIGTFAIGTAWMIPVLAGLAAIGTAYERITRRAREAKEAQDKAIESLEELRRQQSLGPAGELPGQIENVEARIDKLLERIAKIVALPAEGPRAKALRAAQLTKLQVELQKYIDLVAFGEEEAGRRQNEAAEDAAAERLRIAEEANRKQLEAERQFWAEFRSTLVAELDRQTEAWRNAGEAFRDAYLVGLGAFPLLPGTPSGPINIPTTLTPLNPPRFGQGGGLLDDAIEVTKQNFEEAAAVLDIFAQTVASVDSEFARTMLQIIRDIRQLSNISEDASVAIRQMQVAAAAFGTGLAIGGATQNPIAGGALGAFSGAGIGFATGGPVGALVGGLSGLAGGILGAAREAERAAEAMRQAQRAFSDSLDRMVRDLDDTVDRDLSRVREQLAAKMRKLFEVFRAYSNFLPAQRERIIDVNIAAIANARSWEELVAVLSTVYSVVQDNADAHEEWLKILQIARREFERWQEAVERQRFDFTTNLDLERARAFGTDQDILIAEFNVQKQRAIRDAIELLNAGVLTIDQVEELARVLDAQLARSLREAAEAARELTRSLTEDLEARARDAIGQTAEAARARQRAQQRRERAEFADQPEQVRAFLDFVQGLERTALEQQIAAEAAQRAVALAEDRVRLLENQLAVAEDALRQQQQTVAELRRVQESLADFNQSLLTGPQSPLSPFAQLQETQRQFDALTALARGGDITAAQSLPDAGRALIDALRGYFGSGPGFVRGFDAVRAAVAGVERQFAGRVSAEQAIADALQSQVDLLNTQIETAQRRVRQAEAQYAQAQEAARQANEAAALALEQHLAATEYLRKEDERQQQADAATSADIETQTDVIRTQTNVIQVGLTEVRDEVRRLRATVESQTRVLRDEADAVRAR